MNEPGDQIIVRAGRFAIRFRDGWMRGIDAEAALRLCESRPDEIEQLYVIHRVAENGALELAGITADALTRRDCMIFLRAEVGSARRDYDALRDYAGAAPPPCAIQLRFAHTRGMTPSHAVVLVFPQACQTAVGAWLLEAPFHAGDTVESSPAALAEFEATGPQVVLTTTLTP